MRSKNGVLLIQKLGKSKESFRVYGRMIDRRPWQGSSMAPTAATFSVSLSRMARVPNTADLRDVDIGCNFIVARFPLHGDFGSFLTD